MRDAFNSGLALPKIRQRILENPRLDLQATLAMTPSFDSARSNSFQIDNPTPTLSQSCTISIKSAKDSLYRDAAVALMHKRSNTIETLTTLRNFFQQSTGKMLSVFRHFAKVCHSCHSSVKNTPATLMSINKTQKLKPIKELTFQ